MGLFGSRQQVVEPLMGIKLRFTDHHAATARLRERITRMALDVEGMQCRRPPVEYDDGFLYYFKRNLPDEIQHQAIRQMQAMIALEASRDGISSIALVETF